MRSTKTLSTSAFLCIVAAGLGGFAATACSSASSPSHESAADGGTGPGTDAGTNPLFDAGVTLDESTLGRSAPSAAALGNAVTSNNAFAFELYGQVAPTADGGNLLTSPVSASLALTMTYAGAQGTTASQMAQVLQLDGDGGSPFDAQNALSQALAGRAAAALQEAQSNSPSTPPSPSDYQLQVVNSVWGERTYPWASSFLDVLAQSYGTGVYLEDFVGNPAGAENTINAWVSYETADKINDLLPQGTLTSDTRIVLVNAIHLKLPWAQPFQTSATANGTFTRGDGSTVTASFMNQTLETSYVETADAQVVSLPLSGGLASVVFALPKNGLSSLVSSLTPTAWASMTAATTPASVTISLPKFDFTSPTFSLATALKALGMTAAFDPTAANFKGLCATTPDGDNVYIADVLQKATMAVAENGVEAAAATAVIGVGLAAPSQQVAISFDQPFLVSIVDSSGAILFLGQIDDPTASGSQ
jgi:serpin B